MSGEESKDPKARRPRRAEERFRLDLTQEIVKIDEETRTFWAVLKPDPRRYSKIEREEEGDWYLDKYFNTVFDLRAFAHAAPGVPIYTSERTVDSAEEYATERRSAVLSELQNGEYVAPAQPARAHKSLDLADERDLAFISVDICGSTALRQEDAVAFETAHRILVQELGATVGQFQGAILKTTGDGFIGFIDMPSFNTLADSAVDLGGTLLHVLHGAVNPALRAEGLPSLSVRIGADFGPAQIREVRVPLTGYSVPEVTSDALNRAVKIEQSCDPDTFRIGYDLYRLAHVQWLERCHAVNFDGKSVGIPGYEVFEVR
jgi:class 3 adenylate cyclase